MVLALTDTQNYSDIADAIRAKAGTQEALRPSEMAQAIADIPSGGGDTYPVRGDGKIHLWVRIDDLRSPSVCLYFEVRNYPLTIDWGDGTEPDGYAAGNTVNTRHAYAGVGTYEIVISSGGNLGIRLPYSSFGCLMGKLDTRDYVTETSPTPDDTAKLVAAEIPPVFFNQDSYVVTKYMFQLCRGLSKITMPAKSGPVGSGAFSGCSSLTSFVVPEGATGVENNAFSNCASLREVTLPSTLTTIGDYAFRECSSLASIAIPEGVTGVGRSAFNSCSRLLSATLPSTLTTIGDSAFSQCGSLATIAIPEGVTSVGVSAFNGCNGLASASLPSTLASLPTSMFNGCMWLSSVTVPEGVTSIGSSAFYQCKRLGRTDAPLTLPSTVRSIGSQAFYAAYLERLVMLAETPPTLHQNALQYAFSSNDCVITVPAGSLSAYQSAQYWSSYASNMVEAQG